MTRQEFLDRLGAQLEGVPVDERASALGYYAELLDELIDDGLPEDQAVASLDSPESIACSIVSRELSLQEAAALAREQVESNEATRSRVWQNRLRFFGLLATICLLLGILIHSTMYFAMNQLYPIDPLPTSFAEIGESRHKIRGLADNLLLWISRMAQAVCFVLVVVYAKGGKPVAWRHIATYSLVTTVLSLLFVLPFTAFDPQFAGDYLAALWITLPAWGMAILLLALVNCAKMRRGQNEPAM